LSATKIDETPRKGLIF